MKGRPPAIVASSVVASISGYSSVPGPSSLPSFPITMEVTTCLPITDTSSKSVKEDTGMVLLSTNPAFISSGSSGTVSSISFRGNPTIGSGLTTVGVSPGVSSPRRKVKSQTHNTPENIKTIVLDFNSEWPPSQTTHLGTTYSLVTPRT